VKEHSPAPARRITHRSLLRVLIAGFSLVIILLLAGAFIGIGNILTIKENAARLVQEQQSTNRLLEEVHRQQASLSEVFSILARDPDSVDYGGGRADSPEAPLRPTPANFRGILGRSAAIAGRRGARNIFLAGSVPRSRGLHLGGRQAYRIQLP
jgi:hypothetical protein